jgi:hypothetical protein
MAKIKGFKMKSAILYVIAALIAIYLTGCASPRAHMYLGQGLDLATTYYALEVDGRFEEGNGVLGDIEGVVIGKIVVIGILETAAYLSPSSADRIYKIGAFFGYGAGCWNAYQVLGHK